MRTRKLAIVGAVAALLGTTACITDPVTGEQRVSRAAIGGGLGAAGGFLLGDLIGGRNARTERLIGAGIGGLAGGLVGNYMDRQEQELRRRTAGTDIDVRRDGDDLFLNMPSSITFATDQSTIQPQFRNTLNEVAAILNEYNQTYIDVYGHTDSTGTAAYNQRLSEQRAASVADYLSSRGVSSARIATQGFGLTRPIADNNTAAGRAENRRVEIKIVPVTEGDVRSAR